MSVARSRREIAAEQLIQQAIQEGRVPSADEIVAALAELDAKQPFNELDTEPVYFRNGVRISSARVNDVIDIIEQELEAAIEALGISWSTLEATLNTSDILIQQAERARQVAGEAKRMLALTEYADAYRTAKSIDLVSLDDIDTANTDDVFVDTAAGVMRLAYTDIAFKPFTATMLQVYQNSVSSGRGYVEIGEPALVTRPGYGSRHVVQVTSTDANDDIAIVYGVSLCDETGDDRYLHAQDISVVEVDTESTHPMHCRVVGTYDGLNWVELGQAWGAGKIAVSGKAQKATDLRITLRKVKADSVVSLSSALRYGYIFDTGQIRVGVASYEKAGTLYTNPIELSGAGITSVTLDADVVAPEGTSISTYVAEAASGADPDTLQWRRIFAGQVTDLVVRKQFARSINVDTAPKYLEGAGSRGDLWIATIAPEKLVSLDAGINQCRMRAANDTLSSVVFSPNTAAGAPLVKDPVKDLNTQITLSGNTIYRLEFSIWADVAGSSTIGLTSGTPANTYISVNGADVTKSWKRNEVSIGLAQGRNKIVVIVGSATASWVKIVPPDGLLSAIERPVLTDYSQVSSAEVQCAQKGNKVITNFDPSGMVVQISLLDDDGTRTGGTIRVKFVLETADPFATPTLSNLFLVAGV